MSTGPSPCRPRPRRRTPPPLHGLGLLAGRGLSVAAAAIFLGLALLPLIASATSDPFLMVTATRIMIFALAALSLDLALGYGAMVSFGHAAYIGIGAYAVAILSANGIQDILVQALAAILACALFAMITGAIALRTQGRLFHHDHSGLRPDGVFLHGLCCRPMAAMTASPFPRARPCSACRYSTATCRSFYVVLASLVVAFVALRVIVTSRFGRVLRGTRDNAVRMQAIGFAPFPYQLTAYVMAGAIAGIAGVFLANQAEFVSPAYMTWQRSGELIVMVVLGGMGTLIGAIGGAIAFMLVEDWLAMLSEHWKLGLGVLLVLLVLGTRGGLVGGVERLFARTRS